MHVFPQLRKLEEKYSSELAVVGIHSAKFDAEEATQNVRQAILRYEIEHPVVNDAGFEVWRQYAVRAWPTLMFVDPAGKVIGKHEGEIRYDTFDRLIGEMIAEFDAEGAIDRRAIHFVTEREKESARPLSFPGKVLADAQSDRLFIADSNHNRIVVSTLEGRVTSIVGGPDAGLVDGTFEEARFDDPQGMALDGDTLYVADAKNHAIRMVDLANHNAKTIAGTGRQAMLFHRGGAGPETNLNSPWDLELHDGTLYIAMAGFHQLWRMDLKSGTVVPHSGSGREGIVDGQHASAQLAQPNGITSDGVRLYFADSETSAVRTSDFDPAGRVGTIAGEDLFTFGDRDGFGDDVRLQHVQGIEHQDGALYIADTYNNKVKKIDPLQRESRRLLGSGEAGHRDGPAVIAEFHEPCGVSLANGLVFVADTNNHAIRVADMRTMEVTTLELDWGDFAERMMA